MKSFLKNYQQTLILLLGIIVGVIVGLMMKEKAVVLAPFGDVFLNLLLVIIVPLIFLTITTSIAKISTPKRLRKNIRNYYPNVYCYFSCRSIIWIINYLFD